MDESSGSRVRPPSDRTTVRRGAGRAAYDPATIRSILERGMVAHVGVATPSGPVVLPMAYGLIGDQLYLHGAAGNDLLSHATDQDICVTVTLLDGLVFARSPFHNSMNYRCVVVRGAARLVSDGDEQTAALRAISDHVAANWDDGRAPTSNEVRRTRVIAIGIAEASAKIRAGGPIDEPEDIAGTRWGGHVPIHTSFGAPIPSDDLDDRAVDAPAAVTALSETAPQH